MTSLSKIRGTTSSPVVRAPTAPPPPSSRHSFATSVRPGTTTSAPGDAGEYVVALIQSKGAGVEVGISAFNLQSGRMTLTQIADSISYGKTINYLMRHPPVTVLVTDAQVHSHAKKDAQMVDIIQDYFSLKCQPAPRAHWNAEEGCDSIRRLCVREDWQQAGLMTATDRYYALCASAALLHWISHREGVHLNLNSVKIRYETLEGHMFIDADTARSLELVQNNITMKVTNSLYCEFRTNYAYSAATLNSCFTPMGMRLLRATILQPGRKHHIIENRWDAVEGTMQICRNLIPELINKPNMLREVRKCLKSFDNIDLDRLISRFSQDKPGVSSPQQTEFRIGICQQLRKVVTVLPELANAIKTSDVLLISTIHGRLAEKNQSEIADMIDARLNDDTTLGTKGPRKMLQKHARLYAVKKEYNELLDLARTTYQENVSDIMELNDQNEATYGLSTTLEWTDAGYKFSCPLGEMEGVELPKDIINVERGKRVVKFATHELLKRNARMLQTQQEVFLMSDAVVQELVEEIIKNINSIYECSDAVSPRLTILTKIALLDVFSSLAYVSQCNSYTRPRLGNVLVIKNGRHPILDVTLSPGECVPNDVYAAEGPSNFQLVQGPNMSGKSTYLRQIALLTVQAMIGCFVPAEYATFRTHDALLTRLSNDDCMEKNLSTFAAEMATSAMIVGMATRQSLVLIDELGRGTAPAEGVGIAQAIAEELIKAKALVFFATHFQELALTLPSQPGVVSLHLEVRRSEAEKDEFGTAFQYKVVEGVCREEHYGLELAKLASLPESVMQVAWQVSRRLSDLEEMGRNSSLVTAQAMRRKLLVELGGKLQQVVETSAANDPSVLEYLLKLRAELLKSLRTALELERASAPDHSVVANNAASQ